MRNLVPGFILEKFQSGEFRGGLDGAGLFVDLSGFSKMTDRLALYGQHGAETLTEVMRIVFEPLVNSVYLYGGFVVGYAGDSFTAIFAEQHAGGPAVKRCLAAALAMQEHIDRSPEIQTRFGKFPISIKVGLGYGRATWQIFTSADQKHATYCMRGASIRNAVIAEELAQPGTVVVHKSIYEVLKDILDVMPARDCFQIRSVKVELPHPRLTSEPEPAPELMHLFVPDEILRLPIVGEFRQVVNVFIDIPEGITDEALMAPFMETVYALQEHYGGYFLRPDFGDKGFNLLMLWGAPTAHETDILRAIHFVLKLVEKTRLDYRVGITYRMAYSGFMGASLREDYTGYGWGLNLAARLMEHAGRNEIWLDEEIAQRAESQFEIEYLDDFDLKGFARKQKIFRLIGRKELSEKMYLGQLVGRHAELEILDFFIEPMREGKFAGIMVIQGEAGIGKSRLVHTFETVSRLPALWVLCQSDEILRHSFGPFRNWLEKRFGYQEGQSNETNLDSLMIRLGELIDATPDAELASELTRTSSVLASLLNLTQENSLYQQLDPKGRYENTLISLSALIRAESLQKPLILFIEDLHWLDEDSRALLSYLVRVVLAEPDKNYPLAILGTQRLDSKPLEIGNEAYLFRTKLGALTLDDLSKVARNILDHPVHTELLELLNQRSDGNPFFAEQILHYFVDNDLLILGGDGFYRIKSKAANILPTDVNALLIARLDSLAEEVRNTVQTASVLGREFEVRLLSEMLRDDLNVSDKVTEAEKHGIWIALDEIQYLFRHALLRDAAYSMQMESRRRLLHEIALTAMETLYEAEMVNHYGELAFHAEHAQLTEKAIHYLTLAGKQSASRYQNALAVEYFTRALALLPEDDLQNRYDLIHDRAVVYQNTSSRAMQVQDIDTLDVLAEKLQDSAKIAKAMYLRSHYLVTVGDYAGGYEIANRVVVQSLKADDDQAALDAYNIVTTSLFRMTRFDEAMQTAEHGLAIARLLSNQAAESRMLTNKGLIANEQGRHALALDCFQAGLAIARELKNARLEVPALNNLAIAVVAVQRDYSAARTYYEQTFKINRQIGDRYGEAIALGNLGWLLSMIGDFSSARKHLEQALIIDRELGNWAHESNVQINLSSLLGLLGEASLALTYAKDAYEICHKTHDLSGEGWAYLNMGHAYFQLGDWPEAQNSYRKCITIREELNQPNLAAEAGAGLIQVALQKDEVKSALNWSERVYSQMEVDHTFAGADDPLRIYYACYQAYEKIKDPRAQLVLQNARGLLDSQILNFQKAEELQMYMESTPWRRFFFTAIDPRADHQPSG